MLAGTGVVMTADRTDGMKRMAEDRALQEVSAALNDVCRVAKPSGNDEMISIGLLLQQLRSRFRSRKTILSSTEGMSHILISSPILLRAVVKP